MSLHPQRHHVLAALAIAVTEVAIAVAVSGPDWAPVLIVGATSALIATAIAPWVIPVLVLPSVWLLMRAGPSSINMSVSDVSLVAGTALGLRFVPWESARVRSALMAVATYLGILLIAVAAQPTERAGIELLHRGMLLGGSIAVGAAIAQVGKTRLVLRLLLAVSTAHAIRAVLDTVTSGFDPAYPFGIHKNAAGGLLAMTLVIVLLAPRLLGLPSPVRLAVMVTLLAGLAATQSRGAAIALIATMAIASVQRNRTAGLRFAALVSALAAITLVAVTFDDVGINDTTNRFNSYNSRRLTNDYALDQWRDSPLTGVGVRFFRDPAFFAEATAAGESTFGEPHNIVVVNLAESGIVGTAGLVVLLAWLWMLLRSQRTEFASLASMLLLTRLVNTQFDIWWVAGTLTLPFVVIGMALAERAPTPTAVTTSASRRAPVST
ncbi:MAG: O-antigen ligase family protein [Acidimicrobiia bacterium]